MILKTASLIPTTLKVIRDKHTESPFLNTYDTFDQPGSYLCRQCGLALFRANTKFHSGCGWPSFDAPIENALREQRDADGKRDEVLCNRCNAHLGHVFRGEGLTAQNARYCINSCSLDWVLDQTVTDTEEGIFAGGCFWGVENAFQKLAGVVKTEVGYTGGHENNPSYNAVCANHTGHVEAVRVVYDIKKLDYKKVARYFFEIHDPTQKNGQGPDIGSQYLSKIFYYNDTQKTIATSLIAELNSQGNVIATTLHPVTIFWPAENYHQDYCRKQDL